MRVDMKADPRVFTLITDEGTEQEIRWACRLTFGVRTQVLGRGTEVLRNEEGEWSGQRADWETLIPLVVDNVVVGWEGVEDEEGKPVPWDATRARELVPFGSFVDLASQVWQRVVLRGN